MADPDSEVLEKLLTAANRLQSTAVSCPTGFQKTHQTLQEDKGDYQPIPSLLRRIDWLENQIYQQKVAIKAEQNDEDPGILGQDALAERVEELKKELQTVTIDHDIKRQIMKCFQCGNTMVKKLYEREKQSGEGEGKGDEEYRSILKLLNRQTRTASDIMAFYKHITTIRSRLDDTRKHNLELKEMNRMLTTALQEKRNNQLEIHGEEHKSTKKAVSGAMDNAEVLRNILQMLIVGSGIDWAEDNDLADMLMDLGQPLDVNL